MPACVPLIWAVSAALSVAVQCGTSLSILSDMAQRPHGCIATSLRALPRSGEGTLSKQACLFHNVACVRDGCMRTCVLLRSVCHALSALRPAAALHVMGPAHGQACWSGHATHWGMDNAPSECMAWSCAIDTLRLWSCGATLPCACTKAQKPRQKPGLCDHERHAHVTGRTAASDGCHRLGLAVMLSQVALSTC